LDKYYIQVKRAMIYLPGLQIDLREDRGQELDISHI
jgi:hypothetical protein